MLVGCIAVISAVLLTVEVKKEKVNVVNECTTKYDLTNIYGAGTLCNEQGGVLKGYDVSDYTDEISVRVNCVIDQKESND